MKVVTQAELENHDRPEDVWIAIEGKVYALTPFLTDHPGGIDVLLECAGTDGTERYDYAGHSDGAMMTLQRFLVGRLEGCQLENREATGTKKTMMRGDGQLPGSQAPGLSLGRYLSWPSPGLMCIVTVTAMAAYLGIRALRSVCDKRLGECFADLRLFTGDEGPWTAFWAFWAGAVLVLSVVGLGLWILYDRFSKTLDHTREPFSYPATIPRRGANMG